MSLLAIITCFVLLFVRRRLWVSIHALSHSHNRTQNTTTNNPHLHPHTNDRLEIASTIHWFAQVGGDAVDDPLDDGGMRFGRRL